MIALSGFGRGPARLAPACAGVPILDLALSLILSVAVVGLILLAV